MKPDYYYYIRRELTTAKSIDKFVKEVGGPENLTAYDWLLIQNNKCLTNDQVIKYKDYLDWEWLLITYKFTPQFLEKVVDYVEWGALSSFQKLNLEFIKKYHKKLNLTSVLRVFEGNEKEFPEIQKFVEKMAQKPGERERWEQIEAPFFKRDRNTWKVSSIKKEEKPVEPKKAEPAKKQVRKKKEIDYSSMKKDELKKILEKRKVRVYYHDTIPILIQKCKDSEEK